MRRTWSSARWPEAVAVTPLRAFFCAFGAGFLTLVAGYAALASLGASAIEREPQGPLHIPHA